MKNLFIKECSTCDGTGTEVINNTWDHDPCYDQSFPCESCHGEGNKFDYDQLSDRIYEIEDMIDGMLTRIRLTSDTLKDLSNGMFYELLPKYKDRLNTQARALARLELYLLNLKNYK